MTTGLPATQLPGAGDTATIPAGAVCTLDSNDAQTIAGLTVSGTLTTQSMLTVQKDTNPGSGSTTVTGGGILTVDTPDISGVDSTLETDTLVTGGSGGTTPNFTINDSASVDVDSGGNLGGASAINGTLTAKNIDNNSGAAVTLGGTGTVGGNGKLVAEINAAFTDSGTWTILPGNPPGSALNSGNFYITGTLLDNTNLTPDAHIFLSGGTLAGTGSLAIGADFTWSGGTLGPDGGTSVATSGDFRTTGAAAKILASDLVFSSATGSLGGAGAFLINTGVTFTLAAGTLDVSVPSISTGFGSGGPGSFVNGGGILDAQAPSSAPTVISTDFTNDSILEVASGDGLTLSSSAGPLGNTIALDGNLYLDGDLTLLGAATSPIGFVLGSGGGTLHVGDGSTTSSLTLATGYNVQLSGGTLEVAKSGTLTGPATVENTDGTLKLDIGSSTAGLADYSQLSSGKLELEAAPPGPGTGGNSTLAVTGDASLAGTLALDLLDGYAPAPGTVFPVVTAGAIDNQFNSTPPDMTATYGPATVTLTQD